MYIVSNDTDNCDTLENLSYNLYGKDIIIYLFDRNCTIFFKFIKSIKHINNFIQLQTD